MSRLVGGRSRPVDSAALDTSPVATTIARILNCPLVVGLLWVTVLAVAVLLAYHRYREARVFPGDFGIFFRAGQAVAAGRSPYRVSGFVYPPLLAVVLAPFSHVGVLE